MRSRKEAYPQSKSQLKLQPEAFLPLNYLTQMSNYKQLILRENTESSLRLQSNNNYVNEFFNASRQCMDRLVGKIKHLRRKNGEYKNKIQKLVQVIKHLEGKSNQLIDLELQQISQLDGESSSDVLEQPLMEYIPEFQNQNHDKNVKVQYPSNYEVVDIASQPKHKKSKPKKYQVKKDQTGEADVAYKAKLAEEFSMVEQFIQRNLATKIQLDSSYKITIPKKIILNLYLEWNHQNGRDVLFPNQTYLIQMQLTNQLKALLGKKLEANRKYFKGFMFKPEFSSLSKFGDRIVRKQEVDEFNETQFQFKGVTQNNAENIEESNENDESLFLLGDENDEIYA